jgi:hypothetical protein
LDGAFRARDHQHAAVGDEPVDAACGLDRHVAAARPLRRHLGDVSERAGSDGDEKPVLPDFGHRAFDGFLIGSDRPGSELDHRAPEPPSEPIDDRPRGRSVRPAVAEDDRLGPFEPPDTGVDRTVQDRCSDADVDVGQTGTTVGAQRVKERGRVGNGDHVGRADGSRGASADSTESNAAR